MNIYELVVYFMEPVKPHGTRYVESRYSDARRALVALDKLREEWTGPNIARVEMEIVSSE